MKTSTVQNDDSARELELLVWARDRRGDPAIGPIWSRLCQVLVRADDAEPEALLAKLERCGGNTLLNVVRQRGVPYAEIARDVAYELKRFFERKPFNPDDVDACEAFILARMGIRARDVDELCAAGREGAEGKTVVARTKALAKDAITDQAIAAATRAFATSSSATLEAAKRVSQETSRKAAAVAAKSAARRGTKRTTELAAKHALRHALARLLVPLGALWTAWAIVDIAGPAFRKTMPAVTYIALLRRVRAGLGRAMTR
jgi:uncharacterized protein YaaW (UPF0174 family)